MKRFKIRTCVIGLAYAALVLFCMIKPAEEYSISERRRLARFPEFSIDTFMNGEYTRQAEDYVTDQFPVRDRLRSLKAVFSTKIMQKKDTHEIYEKEGYLCQIEYPMDEESLVRAAEIFRGIYERNLKGTDVKTYFSIIPDKNYFLAGETHLSMNYKHFFKEMYGKTEFLTPISIEDGLGITDYYKTDSHWRQEEILDVATAIAKEMGQAGLPDKDSYRIEKTEKPFYGVYYGQAALPVEPEEMFYCTNNCLEQCTVFDYENNGEIPLYDEERANGKDAYELFLGGNVSLVTITNPAAATEKELVVFGDSFSRSMVPLLSQNYQKTTLYDMRYLPSAYVGKYITFTDQDVLFLYSTSVLNNSITLK